VTALAPTVQAFFLTRLGRELDASPHTVDSYRHTFRLLLSYAKTETGKVPAQMDVADLDERLVSGFLDHLESDRGNSVASRNTRLAAIHSFFRFASYRHPEYIQIIRQVLAIPQKKTQTVPRSFLTEAEMDAVIADPTSPRGQEGETTPCSSSPYEPACVSRSSPGCVVVTSTYGRPPTSSASARAARDEIPPSIGQLSRSCAPGWQSIEETPTTRSFHRFGGVNSAQTPCNDSWPSTSLLLG
jgi:hypothetical protein